MPLRRMPRRKDVVQRGRVLSDKHLESLIVSANIKGNFSFGRFSFGPVKRNGNYERWVEGGRRSG